MAEIKTIDFSRFLQNQDFTLHGLIINELNQLTNEKLSELKAAYKEKYAEFDKNLKTGGKNPHSKNLYELDKQQDDLYLGLAAQNRSMMKHFNPEKAEIAYQVNIILSKYGNPCRLPYLQEDAVIKNLIQDLETFNNQKEEDDRPVIESLDLSDVTNRLEKIGLLEWLEQLKLKNAEFMAAYAKRNEENAAIVTGATKKARTETDMAYYKVAKRINSLVDLYGEEDYLTVVNNINQLIDKELATLALHRTTTAKRNAKKKEEDGGKEDDRPVIA